VIDPAYVQLMARYNIWQNNQLIDKLEPVPPSVLLLNRRAFFGSILGTLSHLLWGDTIWMSRFDPTMSAPKIKLSDSAGHWDSFDKWRADRVAMDAAILNWTLGVRAMDLQGNLSFYSSVLQADVEKAIAACLTHFFNHQTHHRGQVHAMMTAAGLDAPVSDLFLMPEDA
jgi:uncharacterized damage-inducible protein DinB